MRSRLLADLVHTVRIEGDVLLDPCHRFKRGFIRPHRIDGTISAGRNAVVGSIALVGAIRRVFATREGRHINIRARKILNRRIGRLANRQHSAAVGDHLSADGDNHAERVRLDRNGVGWAWNSHRFFSPDLYAPELEIEPRYPAKTRLLRDE